MVCGTGFRSHSPSAWDYWCLIPVRFAADRQRDCEAHSRSVAGENQADPFHYIYLSHPGVDIRGAHIGLFVRYDENQGTSVFVMNLVDDGRRSKEIMQEPIKRIKKLCSLRSPPEPLLILLIYLSTAIRWYKLVLWVFDRQLIEHVSLRASKRATGTEVMADRR